MAMSMNFYQLTATNVLIHFLTGNFGKIWSACGQREIQHAEVRMNKSIRNLTCVFFYTSCATEVYAADKNREYI
jgi:hypothetical protein